MSWFLDRPIAQKLVLGFCFVALLAAAVGGIGIRGMRRIVAADTLLYERMTVPTQILGQIAKQFQRVRINTRDLIFNSPTPEKRAERVQRIESIETELDSLLTLYGKTIVSPEMRAMHQEAIATRQRYNVALARTIAFANAGERDSAIALLNGALYVEGKRVEQAIDGMQTRKVADAEEVASSNAVLADTAMTTMVASLVAVLLLASGLGVLLARQIGAPLHAITAVAERLAVGDLADPPAARSRDEIGALATAFARMVGAQRELVVAADRLAAGDTAATVGVRSDVDVLGRAFVRLRDTMDGLVRETTALVQAAKGGDLSKRGDASRYQGAFAALVGGINETIEAIVAPVLEAGAVLDRVAARDLSARVTGSYQGDHARIKDAINTAVANLDEALVQVNAASYQVSAAAGQITAGSQSLAEGSSEQAASLEEVASSLAELASMAQQSAGNAREATALSSEAQQAVRQGATQMSRLAEAIGNIKRSADATAKIVRTIDEIAFQTNLLALNAAVEAARAGEAGRGFAVVADEVRSLAVRAAEAARQTAQLIEKAGQHAELGVSLKDEVVTELAGIEHHVGRVREVLAEVAAASQQQSDGVMQINTAVEQMNGVTQQVAANAEESAAAAEELNGQAETLTAMVEQFTLTTRERTTSIVKRPARRTIPARSAGRQGGGRLTAAQLIPLDADANDRALAEF